MCTKHDYELAVSIIKCMSRVYPAESCYAIGIPIAVWGAVSYSYVIEFWINLFGETHAAIAIWMCVVI